MNNKVLFPALVIIVFLFQGCKKDSLCNCLESTGSNSSETRAIAAFNSIEMDNNIDIVLQSGTENSVEITCGKNLIDGIKTEVRYGVLYITNENKCNWLRDFKNKFTVTVTYTNLIAITNRGSGNLSCINEITSPDFQVDSWNGTGNLNLKLNCNEVRLKLHTGPADIIASGHSLVTYVYTAGNGFIKAYNLVSDYTYVTTKSTGDCEVNATKELGVTILYTGDVYYTGNPSVINSEITGSGKLISTP